MNWNEIIVEDNKIILKGIKDFNIKQILECGQCFRWEKVGELNYIGVAFGKVLEVMQKDNEVIFLNTNEEEFYKIWIPYFDLERDYSKIKNELEKDELLRKAVDYGYGIRLLNQEKFEILISFIISARNSIPSIMKTIKKISEKWGKELTYKGNVYYTFPTAEELKEATLEEIKETGASFRSKYILDTIERVNEGGIDFDLENIYSLSDDECHTTLQNFKGVGAKVADCIMLFSMEKYSAFPVDVWVKRAMIHFYGAKDESLNKIRIFARDKFKNLSGFAQQYLFYYARENKIKVE